MVEPRRRGAQRALVLLAAARCIVGAAAVEKTYAYTFGKWSECSDPCGKGITDRKLLCVERRGKFEKATLQEKCRDAGLEKPEGLLEALCYGMAPTVKYCASCSSGGRCARCVEGFKLEDERRKCINEQKEIVLEVLANGPMDDAWHAKWRPELDKCFQAVADETSDWEEVITDEDGEDAEADDDDDDEEEKPERPLARVFAVVPEEFKPLTDEEKKANKALKIAATSKIRAVISVPQRKKSRKWGRQLKEAFSKVLDTNDACPELTPQTSFFILDPQGKRRGRRPRKRGTTPPWVWAIIVVSITVIGLLVFYALENHHKVRAMEIMLEATTYATTHRGITPGAAEVQIEIRPK